VVEVARRLGVSRQSVHAWIARYEAGGLAAPVDRSPGPPPAFYPETASVDATHSLADR
jgi:transposase-like protein